MPSRQRDIPNKKKRSGASAREIQQNFQSALALHQKGQITEAKAAYEQVLRTQANHADSLHLLGVIAIHANDYPRAVELIRRAIAINPQSAIFHGNLGVVLQKLKDFDASVASYDKAIALKPDYADAYSNRGNLFKELGRHEAAVASLDQAIALRPDQAESHYNRGIALQNLKQLEAAVASYDRAIALKPDYAEAYSNRGVALDDLDRLDEAIASFDKAIALKPQFAEAYANRGNALSDLRQMDAALASCDQAIALKPDYAEAFSNRGNALKELRQYPAAIDSYDRAIALKPDYAEAYSNRGAALQELKQINAAIDSYDRAIALKPGYANAYLNKSLTLLLCGDFKNGWPLHEWRWKVQRRGLNVRNFSAPLWLGDESLAGKRILLHAEQGFGDTIQFCRYARLVSALGATVILEAPKSLLGLLQGLEGVSRLVEGGTALPEFDCHCPLLSLPLAFKTDIDCIPSAPSYLRSAAGKVSLWNEMLGVKTRPRIGLVWSGNPGHMNDANRTLTLASLIPHLPDSCEYVSLQKEVRDADKATLAAHPRIRHFGNQIQDFSDTAALCDLMDIVISVDTSVAHLSCALGRPTWILLPFRPDWRWLMDRSDSPWYPSAKLYRQGSIDDWKATFKTLHEDLAVLAKPVSTILQRAVAFHQQGQWVPAKAAYDEVLKQAPEHADVLHSLGMLAIRTRDYSSALDWIGRAIAVQPGNATFHFDLGVVQQAIRQLDAAIASYGKAIALKPDYAEAYCNRGAAYQDLKQMDAALADYDQAIAFKPKLAELYSLRGNAQKTIGRYEAAVASYDQAIALKPDYAEAYVNRGIVLLELKQFEASIASCDKLIELRPDYAEIHLIRGGALRELKQLEAAIASCDRAIAIKPDFAEAYCNRGVALQDLKQLDAALADYDRAIAYKQDYAGAHCNRGNALKAIGQYEAAIASYDRAIAIHPDYADAFLNKSFALLLKGDFPQGLPLYEWRWKHSSLGLEQLSLHKPLWLGVESLEGKRILLHPEQGLGDTIQFCRYAKVVSDMGATVMMGVPAPLSGLLQGLEGVSRFVDNSLTLPEFDYHCPMMSLPLACKTTIHSIPASQAYLHSDAGKVSLWNEVLGVKTRPRIGLVWSGNPEHKVDSTRSIALSALIPHLPDRFEYLSLQKEIRDSDKAALAAHPNIRFVGDQIQDFSDTAALCDLMDVIISVDTSVAHLGGALGRPTWILLPFNPDWRWLLDRSDSPWYPSARLYRQDSIGDWTSVFGRLRADLAVLAKPDSRPALAAH